MWRNTHKSASGRSEAPRSRIAARERERERERSQLAHGQPPISSDIHNQSTENDKLNTYLSDEEDDAKDEETRMKIRLVVSHSINNRRHQIPNSHNLPYPILPPDLKPEDLEDLRTPVEVNDLYDSTEQSRRFLKGVIRHKELYDLSDPTLQKALDDLLKRRVKDMEEDNWLYDGGL